MLQARNLHGATGEINLEQLLSKTSQGHDSNKEYQTTGILLLPVGKLESYKFTETSNENATGIFLLAEKSKMAMERG